MTAAATTTTIPDTALHAIGGATETVATAEAIVAVVEAIAVVKEIAVAADVTGLTAKHRSENM